MGKKKKRQWTKKDKQKLIVIICISLVVGFIYRMLGMLNGTMLCAVLLIATLGIRKEIRKIKHPELYEDEEDDDNDEDDE